MVSRKERTMDRYMSAGAMFRLYKHLGTKLLTELGYVISAADQDTMMRAMHKMDMICSRAEDRMFYDYPALSNEYINVFYGAVDDEPRNEVDEKVLKKAREAADELFNGKGY